MSTVQQNFFDLLRVKKLLGETGDSLNQRIREAGELSDADIRAEIENIITFPVDDDFKKRLIPIGNMLTLGYFYFLENGDKSAVEVGQDKLMKWVKKTFGHPKALARGPF